jgi:hypothetical protein
MDPTSRSNSQFAPEIRKAWVDPAIVLERQLLVSAQDSAPGGSFEIGPAGPTNMQSFMGPLGTSGGSGTCL